MSQINNIVAVIKQQLKSQGKTYRDVAEKLSLSEASVKRLFAEQNFSLKRLDSLCELLGFDLADLLSLMIEQQGLTSQLTLQQEQQIASDLSLLLVTVCILNGYTFDDLLATYRFNKEECIQKLAVLDGLKLIELQVNNRIKLLVAPDFNWIPNGPIQQFFQRRIEKEYFSTEFDGEGEQLIVLNGLLSGTGNYEFQQRMKRLASEFTELNKSESSLPLSQKEGASVVLAIRRWNYPLFDSFRV